MEEFNEQVNNAAETAEETAAKIEETAAEIPAPPVAEPAADDTAFDPADVQQNKAFAILSYFFLLVLVPIFAAKNSKFARWHANQGLLLAIGWGVGIVLSWFSGITVIGLLFALLSWAVDIVCTVFAIIGIVAAAKGQAKELPIVGKIRLLK